MLEEDNFGTLLLWEEGNSERRPLGWCLRRNLTKIQTISLWAILGPLLCQDAWMTAPMLGSIRMQRIMGWMSMRSCLGVMFIATQRDQYCLEETQISTNILIAVRVWELGEQEKLNSTMTISSIFQRPLCHGPTTTAKQCQPQLMWLQTQKTATASSIVTTMKWLDMSVASQV